MQFCSWSRKVVQPYTGERREETDKSTLVTLRERETQSNVLQLPYREKWASEQHSKASFKSEGNDQLRTV